MQVESFSFKGPAMRTWYLKLSITDGHEGCDSKGGEIVVCWVLNRPLCGTG